jgi:hypothetical protein
VGIKKDGLGVLFALFFQDGELLTVTMPPSLHEPERKPQVHDYKI